MESLIAFLPADAPEVLTLWKETPGVGLGAGDTVPELARFLERNPGTSFIIRKNGRVVGCILGGWDGRRGYIHHLAVHPEYQGRGYGRALVEAAHDAFRRLGVPKLHLFVQTDNPRVVGFYERLGWYWRHDLGMMSVNL